MFYLYIHEAGLGRKVSKMLLIVDLHVNSVASVT